MENEEVVIELRVSYPGSRVSVIGRANLAGQFHKLEQERHQFPRRYERLPDGREQHVYQLPDYDLTFEIEEVIDCKPVRWFAATLEGSPDVYRISEYGANVYARREMPLRDVVREYPPMPDLTVVHDWDEEG